MTYLKTLKSLFTLAVEEYSWVDETFPRDFNGSPQEETLKKIKLVNFQLGQYYKRSNKAVYQVFDRKVQEMDDLPDYTITLSRTVDMLIGKLDESFNVLTEHFKAHTGKVSVSAADGESRWGNIHVSEDVDGPAKRLLIVFLVRFSDCQTLAHRDDGAMRVNIAQE